MELLAQTDVKGAPVPVPVGAQTPQMCGLSVWAPPCGLERRLDSLSALVSSSRSFPKPPLQSLCRTAEDAVSTCQNMGAGQAGAGSGGKGEQRTVLRMQNQLETLGEVGGSGLEEGGGHPSALDGNVSSVEMHRSRSSVCDGEDFPHPRAIRWRDPSGGPDEKGPAPSAAGSQGESWCSW